MGLFDLFKGKAEKTSAVPNSLDLTGYTCFSLVYGCSVERVRQLLEEYPNLEVLSNGGVSAFRVGAVPDAPEWTVVAWQVPANRYDLHNLTMWLLGYSGCPGGDSCIGAAFPPAGQGKNRILLFKPNYENPYMDSMEGVYQNWSYQYVIPEDEVSFAGEAPHVNDYYLSARRGQLFRLAWLQDLERFDWT